MVLSHPKQNASCTLSSASDNGLHQQGGELVWLHVGQAGIQIGEQLWNLFAEDHDIDGSDEQPSPAAFYTLQKRRAVPRNIVVDTDPATIPDTIRRKKRNERVFSLRQAVSGRESSGGLYPRGCRAQEVGKVEDTTRLLLEEADTPKGFVLFYAEGGGTGSGVSSALSRLFEKHMPKMAQVHFAVSPSPAIKAQGSCTVEAYNTALLARDLKDSRACMILTDNDGVYYQADCKALHPRPDYSWVNHIISHAVATASAGWRFPSCPAVKFEDLATNLVPYPYAKYPVMSFAPLFNVKSQSQELFLTGDVTRELFEPRSFLIRCDPRSGFFAATISYRGPTVSAVEVAQSLTQQVQRQGARFLPWIKPSFKIGITPKKPPRIKNTVIPKCGCMVTNTTGVKPTWEQIHYHFYQLYNRKAFFHWYLREGTEEQELAHAGHTVLDIVDSYTDFK